MKKEKTDQEKQMEMMMIAQQAQQLQQQLQALEEKLTELELIKQSLDEVKGTKQGTEVLVPVSNGIFAKAELKDNKEVAVNVGAGTVVTKSFDEAKGLISKQSSELAEMHENIASEMKKLSTKIEEMQG